MNDKTATGKNTAPGDAPSAPPAPEVLAEGRFLRFLKRRGWEYVERPGLSGIVVVAGVTDAGEMVLVSQWREPVDAIVVEWPAGLAGDSDATRGEPLETAARRELLEETGYSARSLRRLLEGPPSAGISSEIVTFFVAEGLRREGAGGGVDGEKIRVHLVPLSGFDEWVAARLAEGWMVDPKVFAGAYWLGRELEENEYD